MDPRVSIIEKRLEPARRILGVTGGKGGIGKSVVASTLALGFAGRGLKTGLFDLDFTGPCDHVILGAEDLFPTEEHGLEPPTVAGVQFMSVTYFIGETAAPLRGADVTNALLEILAITRWPELDVLVIDLPPGLGDAALDLVRLIPRIDYLAVAGSSKVVRETVRRNLHLLTELRTNVAGVVENMRRVDSGHVAELAARFEVPFLGALPFDDTLEDAIGAPAELLRTPFAIALAELTRTL